MKKAIFNFSNKKIVFTDWLFLEAGRGNSKTEGKQKNRMMPYGVELRCFKPQISKNPILIADKPWEGAFIGSYISTIQDPNDGKIKLYYEAYSPRSNSDSQTVFCYAESTDGINFIKPNLSLVEWQGSKENNIIFKPEMHPNKRGIHGAGIFMDQNPDCPSNEKYKMMYDSIGPDRSLGYCWGAVSGDGLKWKLIENPLVKTWADTQTIVRWISEEKKYIGFFRMWHYDRRQIYKAESDDFYNWSDPVPVFTSDPTLPIDVDYYTNGFCRWPGCENAYLMMPTNYRRTLDNLEVEMYTSRDLVHWYRMKGNPIIKPEDDPEVLRGGQYLGTGLVDDNNGKWSLPVGIPWYYHNEKRNYNGMTGEVRWASWREDGFTGLVIKEKGEFWTQPSFISGNQLQVNAWTHPGGSIQIALIDDFIKKPLPGFSLNDCIILRGNPRDKVWREVKWNEGSDLSDFDDVRIRLHFKITRGTVHALHFHQKK